MLIHSQPVCKSTKELSERVKNITILASVIRRKSANLNDQLQTCSLEYNPHSIKSIGRLTKELDEVRDLCYSLSSLSENM